MKQSIAQILRQKVKFLESMLHWNCSLQRQFQKWTERLLGGSLDLLLLKKQRPVPVSVKSSARRNKKG